MIKDQAVEFVQQFKYHGSIIDNKLTFELQVDFVHRKAHQCVYFYHKLRGFHVDSTFMIILIPVLLNLFLFFLYAGFGSLTLRNKKRSVVTVWVKHTKIVGVTLNDLPHLYKVRRPSLYWLIRASPPQKSSSCFHPAVDTVSVQDRRTQKLICPRCYRSLK